MKIYFVVHQPRNWPLKVAGVEVLQARQYLTDPVFQRGPSARVFNLCSSYRYQSTGYYVSLLGEARGHRPMPDIATIRDLQVRGTARLLAGDLDELIQKSMAPIQSPEFVLSVYFGRSLARRHDRLCRHLFNLLPAPLMRARFRRENGRWRMLHVGLIGVGDMAASHRAFVVEAALDYFRGGGRRRRPPLPPRFRLAVLHDPADPMPPSNPRALRRLAQAGERREVAVDLIEKDDYHRLPEFDGLFIRETTYVDNHTFRFARRAENEGLAVIDDPTSILRCTNKVYLAEVLARRRIRTPRTIVVHRDNAADLPELLGFPCILKLPDSSFSAGVFKVDTREALADRLGAMLEESDLVIAQQFLPTPYDWRIGILAGRPLFACKYFMAGKHWQIIHRRGDGRVEEGSSETLAIEDAPVDVVRMALRATRGIGNGLYGVDLKRDGRRCYVIEVNDNPNIDAGCEDAVLKDRLYDAIIDVFVERMERNTAGR